MTRMILIRHADPGYRDTFAGSTDVPLVPGAFDKAKEFAQSNLRGEEISALYSSDMLRSAATADAIGEALGLKVSERFPELREMDFGKWEMMTFAQVESKFPGEAEKRKKDFWNYNGYNGESMAQVRDRVIPVLEQLLKDNEEKTFAVVCHGVVNRIAWSRFMGREIKDLWKYSMYFLGSLFFKKTGDNFELEKMLNIELGR